ncbi:hypothetical protein fugu_004941 [Takifugu bimaculatus]|uniref:EF-hand domain-containing protein n=1 Tax=Takifugu bimaculatus TaxID=433685 RepID=A0A4Z2B9J8_9TELE|nr:hypothetical protein fugu_004941 [Takifugu bimaculatus]
MLACAEMITMCLQSAKKKHLRAQQQQPPPLRTAGQGLTIFYDIFRRADKNDDGKLSFEEFNTYFADGILTTEELQELFYSIDGRQNSSDVTVCFPLDYFSQHLGEYLNVLSALESLNIAILKAMDKTKEEYQGSSVLGQFVTRFMLRETSSQLLSLQRSLQCAMEAVEEQSSPAPSQQQVEQVATQRSGRRCARRGQNKACIPARSAAPATEGGIEDEENWCSQINKLQQLLDKLECQSPKLEPLKEDTLASTYKSNILLVQRQMAVTDKDLDDFGGFLKSYVDATSTQPENLHYLQSDSSKVFQRHIIDMLEDTEVVSTMLIPAPDCQRKYREPRVGDLTSSPLDVTCVPSLRGAKGRGGGGRTASAASVVSRLQFTEHTRHTKARCVSEEKKRGECRGQLNHFWNLSGGGGRAFRGR